MWKLEKTVTFEASHQLPNHDGKCARLHGHSWKLTICVKGHSLHKTGPKAGMVLDYSELKQVLAPIVEQYLDHWHLNDTTGLANPTSEELAKWLYQKFIGELRGLEYVRVEETCTSACTYYGVEV